MTKRHVGSALAVFTPTASDNPATMDYVDTAIATRVPNTRTINTHALSSNVTLTADDIGDGTTNKAYTATEKTKLSGIAAAATANSSDATLEARANHTGTQTASTISDFSTAADARITAAVGVSVQAYDADLGTIAGLTATTDNIIQSVGSAWASRTPTQVKTALGLVIGTNVQAWDADLDTWATKTAPSSTVVGTTDTQTISGKRVTPRVSTTGSSATPTINTDNVETYGLTAQTVDITSFTTNLTGTPTDSQKLWIYIVGTAARAITWGAKFEAGPVALPTTTVTTQRLDVGFVWNAVSSKWRCVASGSAA